VTNFLTFLDETGFELEMQMRTREAETVLRQTERLQVRENLQSNQMLLQIHDEMRQEYKR
jgi:hypothetical protein